MEFKDYYAIMGLSRDATQDEVKRAYRKLARKFHPDVSKETDAEARFKEVGEAYEVLKDPEKRAAYDQLGSNWRAGQEFRPPPDWDTGFEFSGGGFTGDQSGEFSDFFEQLFGRAHPGNPAGARRSFRMRGEDRHARVRVDIDDAYHGATRDISLRLPQVTPEGHVVTREHRLRVRIPKGVRQGQHIRLAGQGGPGAGGGEPGDLYLEVEFDADGRYRAEGRDVYMDLPVAPWEAVLGGAVKVRTPSGEVELKIPANSGTGRRLRLKGRGIPSAEPGDLYVVLKVVMPPAGNETQREAWRRLAGELDFDPRATTSR